jgi:ubiquinone/menaquinone biosynthesis C-methylase UbiE
MARKKVRSSQIKALELAPIYSAFASIYDQSMTHVPMQSWARYLMDEAGKRTDVLDLGCGTGMLLDEILRKRKVKARGVDASPAMLEAARRRLGSRAELQTGDLRRTGLPDCSVDWVVCTHDSINYLENEEAMTEHLKEVLRILRPGGLYSFDATTEANLTREFDGQVREEMIGDVYLHWSNYYDRARQMLISTLRFQDGQGMRTEVHEQRFYSQELLGRLICAAGFEEPLVEGDYQKRPPKKGDAFMNFHCRKPA